jgi:hypothetical protein
VRLRAGDVPNDMNTFVFNLNVSCSRNPEAAKGETDPKKLFRHEAGACVVPPASCPFCSLDLWSLALLNV